MSFLYEKLEWDSNFFGYKVGRILGDVRSVNDFEQIKLLIEQNGSRLTYFSSQKPIDDHLLKNTVSLNFCLVDKKTTYFKKINSKIECSSTVTPYLMSYPEKKLIDLSIQSGIYSRFKIDQNIKQEKFEELYRLWIINSVKKEIADEVLVYKESDKILGFVTLRGSLNYASIGLIGVDYQYRGKGIGKNLMLGAEKWFSNKGFDSIQVVTQGDNKPACILYEKCLYRVNQIEYFYHIWSNNDN